MWVRRDGKTGWISADVMKIVAAVSMLIDHIGAVFCGYLEQDVYFLLRAVGRMAFPIFAFMIVEGYFHTKDVKKYLLRLIAFAVLSEIPFDIALYSGTGKLMYWGHQNACVTLALGLAVIWLLETIRNRITSMNFLPHLGQLLLQVVVIFVSASIADMLGGDYGHMGIYLIVLFYYFRNNKANQVLGLLAWLLIYDAYLGKMIEVYGAVVIVLILFYNGEKGNIPVPKWFFYVFYPVHFLILAAVRGILM